jgi:hypothetical protein
LGLAAAPALRADAPLADAPAAGVSVTSAVDKSRITIGDLIRYTVTVTHPEGAEVRTPGTGANLGGFDIRAYEVAEPEERDGAVVSRFNFMLSTFFTGEFVIPPLPVAYKLPGDTAAAPRVLATPSIRITVDSVKPSEAGDIRDVKPPMDIPLDRWRLAARIGIGLAALGLAAAALWWLKRRRLRPGAAPGRAEAARPPHETALEALDALNASDLLDRGEVKAFYIELSEIIRRYIGGRYFVVAMEMTTTEVLEGLEAAGVPAETFGLFESFFRACDLVKFAKYRPPASETARTVDTAYALVHRTKIELVSSETRTAPPAGVELVSGETRTAPPEETAQGRTQAPQAGAPSEGAESAPAAAAPGA